MEKRDVVVKSGGGVSFLGLLTILFIGLKLGGVINWSWLWVLAPLWIPFSLGVATVIFFLLLSALCCFVIGVLALLEDKKK